MYKKRKMKYTKEEAIKIVEQSYEFGEPIFIIRAKDRISYLALQHYANLLKDAVLIEAKETDTSSIAMDSDSYKMAEAAEKVAVKMLEWQGMNFEKVKLPD